MRIAILMLAALTMFLSSSLASAGSILLKEGRIPLFNGTNLDGWARVSPERSRDSATSWQVRDDGVLRGAGRHRGYLRTEHEYGDYRLTLEWRWRGEGGKGGVLLHVQEEDDAWPRSIEAHLAPGNAGDFWVIKGITFNERLDATRMRTAKMTDSSENPIGEWNALEVICAQDSIEVYINGVLQNRATHASVDRGHIALQSEGGAVEFRNIILHPLDPPSRADQATGDEHAQDSGQGARRGS